MRASAPTHLPRPAAEVGAERRGAGGREGGTVPQTPHPPGLGGCRRRRCSPLGSGRAGEPWGNPSLHPPTAGPVRVLPVLLRAVLRRARRPKAGLRCSPVTGRVGLLELRVDFSRICPARRSTPPGARSRAVLRRARLAKAGLLCWAHQSRWPRWTAGAAGGFLEHSSAQLPQSNATCAVPDGAPQSRRSMLTLGRALRHRLLLLFNLAELLLRARR